MASVNSTVLNHDIRQFLVRRRVVSEMSQVQTKVVGRVATFGQFGALYFGDFAVRDGGRVGGGKWAALVGPRMQPGHYGLRLMYGGKVFLAQG